MSKYCKLLHPYHKMNVHSVYEIRSEHYDYYEMKNGIRVPKNLVTFNTSTQRSNEQEYSDEYWDLAE